MLFDAARLGYKVITHQIPWAQLYSCERRKLEASCCF